LGYTINNIMILTAFAFFTNLPFGYVRAPTKKFSFKWFLYIHITIPFIILLRMHFGIGFAIIPVTITFAVLGQIIGARYYKKKFAKKETSSD
jgi:hypothetical protein